MADEGPTVAGSIVGKLSLDKAQWDADIADAQAQAERLGRTDPNIRVHADTVGAVAQLEAVQLALNRTTDDSVENGALSAVSSVGVDTLALSEDGLAGSMEGAAVATDTANGSIVTMAGLIVGVTGLLVGLIALAIPLGAALIGIAGGFVALAGTGVVAVKGIQDAMTNGTAEGKRYQDGLTTIKGIFDDISKSAASKLLGDFDKAIALIAKDAAPLTKEVNGFVGPLGNISLTGLNAVLNAMPILNPLFQAGAAAIGSLVKDFDKWVNDGGLQKFVAYAQKNLPAIETMFKDIGTDVGLITQALSYVGPVIVQIITIAAQVMKPFDDMVSAAKALDNAVLSVLLGIQDLVSPLQTVSNLWATITGQQHDYSSGPGPELHPPGQAAPSTYHAPGHAGGGSINGPGTTTSDSIVTALSAGEYVLTASDVSAMGGPSAVDTFRNHLHSGGASSGGQFTGTLVLDSGQFLGAVSGVVSSSSNASKVAKSTGLQRQWGG